LQLLEALQSCFGALDVLLHTSSADSDAANDLILVPERKSAAENDDPSPIGIVDAE